MAASNSRSERTNLRAIDRDRVKQSWADVHPGVPSQQRLDMCLERLIDALCDELEGKR